MKTCSKLVLEPPCLAERGFELQFWTLYFLIFSPSWKAESLPTPFHMRNRKSVFLRNQTTLPFLPL